MNMAGLCFTRALSRVLVVCLVASSWPLPAGAEIIPTERSHALGVERVQLQQFLARQDVRERLEALGVSPDNAAGRIDALGEDEVRELAARLETLPAGGIDVLGALIVVFLVLLLTDFLGYTRIFPFTRR